MKIFDCDGICRRKEKTRLLSWLAGLDPAIKRKLIMRINFVAFFLLFTMMHVSASVHAQKITLSVDKAPLNAIFKEIEVQSGFEVWYNNTLLENTKPVSIKMSGDLKTVLDKIFADQPLTYEIVDKTIVIKRKPTKVIEKSTKPIKAIKISGTVTDEKGNRLSGVTVKLKGSNTTTVTATDGTYTIDVPDEKSVLQFSYVGYESFEEGVNARTFLTVILKQTTTHLSEVGIINTGYQLLPKERATGSFVHVNNELLNRRVSTNLLERLDGVAPGVFFNGTPTFNGTSTAGRLSTVSNTQNVGITIRGQNSFSATTAQPLIVVDNFPYEGEIANINPNDVESITILKDAAAASIWGARSGNGVIVITTKKGVRNKKLIVEVNSNLTVVNKPDLFYSQNFLNSHSYIDVEKYLFDAGYFNSDINNKSSRPTVSPAVEIFARQRAGTITAEQAASQLDELKSNDVRNDYNELIYQPAVKQQYSVSFRGGGENLAYALSTGFDHNRNDLVGNSYERITINSTNTYTPMKNLDLTAGINYSRNKIVENNDFAFRQYTATGGSKYSYLYPYSTLTDGSGGFSAIDNGIRMSYLDEMEAKGFLDWHYRPLEEIANNDNSTGINDLMLRFSAKYQVIPQLNAEFLYQNERQIIERKNLRSQDTYYARNLINRYSAYDAATGRIKYVLPLGGILNTNTYDWNSNNFRGQLNYIQKFSKHEITALTGAEVRELVGKGVNRLSLGYSDQFGTSVSALDFLTAFPTNPSGSARIPSLSSDVSGFTNRYISYFANAGYNYDDRYTITVSGRKDGANIFGVNTNDRVTPLWSAGVGWNIGKEQFYKLDWLPLLSFRASYGFNGNVNRNGTAFLTGTYKTDEITGAQIISGTDAPNPELRWEKIKNINVGFDFALKNNVISGTIEGFYKRGFDLFQKTVLAPQTGFTDYISNAANSSSKGIDLMLRSQNLKGLVSWSTTLLLSTLNDKVLKYDPPVTATTAVTSSAKVVGYPMFALFRYKWAGLNPENGNPQGYLNGKISEDYTAIRNNFSPDSLVFSGTLRPTAFGALRNDFTYGDFSLSVNIVYKFGYVFPRSSTTLNYREVLQASQHEDYDNRWQKQGDEFRTNVPSLVYPNNSDRNTFYQNADVLVEKGDHVRLQDIRLAYLFPKRTFGNARLSRLQIYAYGNNIGILWRRNKLGLDPDADLYPNPRSMSFGLSANF